MLEPFEEAVTLFFRESIHVAPVATAILRLENSGTPTAEIRLTGKQAIASMIFVRFIRSEAWDYDVTYKSVTGFDSYEFHILSRRDRKSLTESSDVG